jgi:hypothetical protein
MQATFDGSRFLRRKRRDGNLWKISSRGVHKNPLLMYKYTQGLRQEMPVADLKLLCGERRALFDGEETDV